MISKVEKNIVDYKLIDPGDTVVLGLSGGPDSVSLFFALHALMEPLGFKLVCVHLNHMFRGEDADKDQVYVKNLANQYEVPCFDFKIDVRAIAKADKLSEEEAGRNMRYKLFHQVAEEVGANKIAVAQNLEDQVETVLMRIMRGTGLDGLAGMPYIRKGEKNHFIIRPLLNISRSEIEDFCKVKKLSPVMDLSNGEKDYTRNKIRLELIPYIEENFNPAVKKRLFETIKSWEEDKSYIYEGVTLFMEDQIKVYEKGLSFSRKAFEGLHRAVKKRVLLEAVKSIGLLQGVESVHLENVLTLIHSNKVNKSQDLPQGFVLWIEYDEIWISKKATFDEKLEIGKQIEVKVNLEELRKLDAALRVRKPGDHIHPKGMEGSKKLKDFFIDKKIPKRLRDNGLLLAKGEEVVWIIGYYDPVKAIFIQARSNPPLEALLNIKIEIQKRCP